MDNFLYISLADSVYSFKYVNSYIILVWYSLQPRTPTFNFNCCHSNFFYHLYSLPFIFFFVRFIQRFPSSLSPTLLLTSSSEYSGAPFLPQPSLAVSLDLNQPSKNCLPEDTTIAGKCLQTQVGLDFCILK